MLSFQQHRQIAFSSLSIGDFDVQMTQRMLEVSTTADAIRYIQRVLDMHDRPDIFHLTARILSKRLPREYNRLAARMMLGLSEKSTRLAFKSIQLFVEALCECDYK